MPQPAMIPPLDENGQPNQALREQILKDVERAKAVAAQIAADQAAAAGDTPVPEGAEAEAPAGFCAEAEGPAPAAAAPKYKHDDKITVGPQTEDMKQLDAALHAGLEALLIEAKKRNILKPPYGRGPLCLPYDEYTKELTTDEEDALEDEESIDWDNYPFKWEYGFNPLMFLANHLRDNNPNNLAEGEAPAPAPAPSPAPASLVDEAAAPAAPALPDTPEGEPVAPPIDLPPVMDELLRSEVQRLPPNDFKPGM